MAEDWTVYYNSRLKEYKVERLGYEEKGWTRKCRAGFSNMQARMLAMGMATNHRQSRQQRRGKVVKVNQRGENLKLVDTNDDPPAPRQGR